MNTDGINENLVDILKIYSQNKRQSSLLAPRDFWRSLRRKILDKTLAVVGV